MSELFPINMLSIFAKDSVDSWISTRFLIDELCGLR